MSGPYQEELLEYFDQLNPGQQRLVVDLARALAPEPVPCSGTLPPEFAGIMAPEEAAEMMRVIEEGCEQVYPDEW